MLCTMDSHLNYFSFRIYWYINKFRASLFRCRFSIFFDPNNAKNLVTFNVILIQFRWLYLNWVCLLQPALCTENTCLGSLMGIPGRGDVPREPAEVLHDAKDFLGQYFASIRRWVQNDFIHNYASASPKMTSFVNTCVVCDYIELQLDEGHNKIRW